MGRLKICRWRGLGWRDTIQVDSVNKPMPMAGRASCIRVNSYEIAIAGAGWRPV
jgi:hypothetical protein